MIICVKSNDKCYGTVGKPTDIRDGLGNTLTVGDIVLVTHERANWQKMAFVCQYEDRGEFYIPCIPHIRKEDVEGFTCEKVVDFSKLKCGMSIGDFILKKD